jgi:hypothetical protein
VNTAVKGWQLHHLAASTTAPVFIVRIVRRSDLPVRATLHPDLFPAGVK